MVHDAAPSGRTNDKGGLGPRTVGRAHCVLGKALRGALRLELVTKNVIATISAPKVDDAEMVIVQDILPLSTKCAVTIRMLRQ